ncbi:MAG: hypothetical protein ABJB03_08575 [Rhodoglobus sp.]
MSARFEELDHLLLRQDWFPFLRSAVTCATLVLVLTGCSVDTQSGGTEAIVVRASDPSVAMQSVVVGELAWTAGDCVGLLTEDGSIFTIVFPPGTSFSAESREVLVPGRGVLDIGSEITDGVGGFLPLSDVPKETDIPVQCQTDQIVWLNT